MATRAKTRRFLTASSNLYESRESSRESQGRVCSAHLRVFFFEWGRNQGGLARKGFLFMEEGESMVIVQRTLARSFF